MHRYSGGEKPRGPEWWENRGIDPMGYLESTRRDEMTRLMLVRSLAFQALVADVDLVAIANTAPMRVDDLSDDQHVELRLWSLGDPKLTTPARVSEYFSQFRKAREDG